MSEVTDMGGWYVMDDPHGRGTWKVFQWGGGWIANGKDPADWHELAILGAHGESTVFRSAMDAIAAIRAQVAP